MKCLNICMLYTFNDYLDVYYFLCVQVDCESLTNCGVKALGEHCKKLSNIELQGVPFVSDEGLLGIIMNGCIWNLSLAECAVTDITLRYIADYCSFSVSVSGFIQAYFPSESAYSKNPLQGLS